MNLIPFALMISLLSPAACLLAQDKTPVKFGKVSREDFTIPVTDSSSAVIIADVGYTSFTGNKKGWFSYVFKRKTRIKILDKKAFGLATVKISLYSKDDDEEKLDDLTASTYNLENGTVIETKLAKNDLFKEKNGKNHVEKRFTMPAVKEGSIIEYTYTINSDFEFNIPDWEFQNINYPCLWSEYEVAIPSLLIYNFLRQGFHSFYIDKAGTGSEIYITTNKSDNPMLEGQSFSINASVNKHRWVMKNVPSFNVESYISTPRNYIDRIEFQLSQVSNGETVTDVMNSWAKATEQLLKENDFGAQLWEDNYWLNATVDELVKGSPGQLDEAKKIYYYISNNFTCTSYYDKYIRTSLQDVFKKRIGNVGELNLLLVAMLLKKGISASPVLLSTREYGFNTSRYPVMDRLNYVICKAKLNDKDYYIDASDPFLGFGWLAENCYNGHARIISNTDSASVFFYADSLKEKKITNVFIGNDEKEGFSGSFQSKPGYYESYDLRKKIKKDGEKEYVKKIKSGYSSDIDIKNVAIDSLEKTDFPVTIHYDFFLKPDADIIYFNPMMSEGYKQNPFKSAERIYPVEMPYPTDETYVMNMEVPDGFIIEEIPKSAKVNFNEGEGFFEYLIQKDDTHIQLRSRIKINRATFEPEEYSTLRDFFAYIIKKQGEQIVFKKKK